MNKLSRFLFGTIRGRIIISVALVHAVMMSLFIVDLTRRQRDMLLNRQTEEATALSQSLATSSAGWIAAADIAGLQELADAQSRYPEVIFVIIAGKDGRVLASTDKSQREQFMVDLPREADVTVISSSSSLVDVAVPAMIAGKHVGWTRVGIGQRVAGEKLTEIIRDGVLYAIAAIIIGSIIAWLMGRQITRRLYSVQETFDKVRSGNYLVRSDLSGNDEAAVMAREFNSMLDTLAKRNAELRESNELLSLFIKSSPIYAYIKDVTPKESRVLVASENFQDMIGIPGSQMVGKTMNELFPPTFAAKITSDDWNVVAEGEILKVDEDLNDRNYTTIKFPITIGGKKLLAGYTIDITERKRVEKALHNSEAKTRTILDSISTGVMIIDPEKHIITDVNSAAMSMIGESKEKIIGSHCHKFVCPAEYGKCPITDLGQTIDNSDRILINKEGVRIPIIKTAVKVALEEQMFLLESFTDITARKQMENELTQSEEKWRSLVANSPDYIALHDVEGRYLFLNHYAEGFSEKDVLGKKAYDYISEESREIYKTAFEKCIHTMAKQEIEYSAPGDNLKTRLYESSLVPLIAKGNEINVLVVARDITARKQMEEMLRENEERFRSLYENSTIGLYRTTPDGKIILANPTLVKMLGFLSFEELAQRNLNKEGYGSSYERKYFIEQIEKNGTIQALESLWDKKDGTTIFVSESAKVIRDSNGKTLYYDGTVEDITERKHAEQLIRESARKYRMLHESMMDAYVATDIQGHIIDFNHSYIEMLGYNEAEIRNLTYIDLTPAKWHEFEAKLVQEQILPNGYSTIYEKEYIRKDGTTFPVELRVSVIKDDTGNPSFMWAIVRDITERKQAEEALRVSELRFKHVSESAQEWIWEVDSTGRYTYSSSIIKKLLGYEPEEIIGKKYFYDFFEPKDKEQLKRGALGAFARKESFNDFVNCNIHKDGRKVFLSTTGSPVLDKNGNLIGYRGVDVDITERKRAEDLLRENENRMRMIIEGTPYLFFYTQDENAKTTYVSPSVEQITGYPVHKWMNQSDWFITDNKINEYAQERTKAHLRGEITEGPILVEVLHSANYPILLEVYENPILLSGKVIGIQGVVHNITERKRAEESLKMWANIFEHAEWGVGVSSKDGKSLANLNPTFAKMHGYTVEELMGQPLLNLYPRDVHTDFEDEIQIAQKKGHHIFETLHIRKDGTVFPVLMDVTVVRDQNGEFLYRIVNVQDITERKRAEENIRMLSRAMEQSPASIVITDLEGKIEYVNPKFTQVTGYTYTEAIGQNTRILKSGEKSPDDYKQLWGTITAGKEWRGEFHNKKKSGKLYWESALISPIKNVSGETTHYLAIKEDITEKKLLEEQLLRAQRMESIGTLAAGIAHDLNNVLAPIMLSIEVLRKRTIGEDTKRMLDTIESSAKRGSDIVRQVLTFSRGVEGERVLLQPKHLIDEIIKIAKETFPKSIEIKTDIPNNLFPLSADPTQVHQVLLNVCVNARDAMPKGGKLTIKVENIIIDDQYASMDLDAKPGQYVVIAITDTGIGIPPEILNKIFEPFFTTKEIGKGTGLGLSTTYTIVKAHGGFIRVNSKVGKGTTLNIYLPASMKHKVASKEEMRVELPVGHGETILVVDDEASVREITKNMLETYGYKVITASDGMESLSIYAEKKNEISIILMDMVMPIMGGYATIQVLMKMNPKVIVIPTSGLQSEIDTARSLLPELKYSLIKPYSSKQLLEILTKVITK
ncbi:MAG: PAS domain S-box protein [Ignavibacteriales bacterium]|nr:PAS domain S-box protein [Ignavibacteriales bacterium]